MTEYRLFATDQVAADLAAIAGDRRPEVERRLARVVWPELRRRPRSGPRVRRLRGSQPETWRYRIGSWRLFYEIEEEGRIVCLLAAVHRASAH
ncbi:MAG: type II toxin-antitoxin system RelE/ParE family toxin [Thermoanaerobaculia bacterium]|nr:type II toxin-antitoxin system RelE/ParE family toxin [Thermoanaerobaculia bacterium]